jgi:carboxyl-terminal processing protease
MENNQKSTSYWIPIVMAICLAVGLFLGNVLAPKTTVGTAASDSQSQKIQDIIHVLDNSYVDSVDYDDLFESTISDMLHKLDPHSNYIPARDLKAINESIEGRFGGVGIRFFIIRDTVCITNVLPGSPAMKSGLKAGDKILGVDKEKLDKTITNDGVMGLLKGLENTDVHLTILRDGKQIKKKVTRGSIPVESVVAAYMMTDKVGYIRIDQFSMSTAMEFLFAAQNLKQQGLKKLIIDVRGNGGGLLTGATDIADAFLPAGTPIVETKGEHSPSYIYRATRNTELADVEVAVLINSNSASASEILAGALQDNDRGTIIGRRSFGKGLVQEDKLLRDGSNLRLTIARYYTPTGRCIQKPYSGDYHSYYEDQMDRYENGEMYKVDSSLFVDSLKYTTPKGKVVYGGGGIMPDVFIPYDTVGSSWYFTELRYSSVFTTFAFDYVQDKRSKWSSPQAFNKAFRVTDDILMRFVKFAESEYGIKRNAVDIETSKVLIAQKIKGEIARQIWVEQGYFQVVNSEDVDVQEALKFLR